MVVVVTAGLYQYNVPTKIFQGLSFWGGPPNRMKSAPFKLGTWPGAVQSKPNMQILCVIWWHYLSNATCLMQPHLFSTALLVYYG